MDACRRNELRDVAFCSRARRLLRTMASGHDRSLSRLALFSLRLTSGTLSLGDTAIDSRAVEVPPPKRSTTLTLAVLSHECNVVLRFLAGYPIRPRRRCGYKGLRVVIAPPQARSHVSRAPPEGLDWSSTREGFPRRAIGRPPQAFEPAPNEQGGPASQPEPLSCVGRGGLRARPSAKDAPP